MHAWTQPRAWLCGQITRQVWFNCDFVRTEDHQSQQGVEPQTPAPADNGDAGVSIQVSVTELDEEVAIPLDGEAPSVEEQHRAFALLSYLREILPRLSHAADAAQVQFEIAEQLRGPLEDVAGALEASRAAFRRQPRKLHIARAYRKAALQADSLREAVTALDAEAKRMTAGAARAALHVERALLLNRFFDNDKAAQYAYKRALDNDPSNVIALTAMERAAATYADFDKAAGWAQKLAGAVTDPKLRAEHQARAARHLESSGDIQSATTLVASAHVDAAESPAVSFALERMCFAEKAYDELIALRKWQIEKGVIEPASGWFDVGVIARYGLGNHGEAIAAFKKAAREAGEAAAPCFEELSWLYAIGGDHKGTARVLSEQLRFEQLPQRRAALWHRLARVHGDLLDDDDAAIKAFENALAEDPSYYPVLADAGRLFHRSGSQARLLTMHRLEAQAAETATDRAGALRRMGEILVQDPQTRDEGIVALRQALEELPGHLSAFGSLERALKSKEAWAELVQLYERELERTEEPSRRRFLLSEIGKLAADRLDDPTRAIAALTQAVAVDATGGPSPLITRLAELLEETEEHDELVPVLTRIADATNDRSERATTLERLAMVHERRGRIEDAVLAYKRAVGAAPPSHPAHASAGRAFLRTERYRELLEVLEAGLATAPPSGKAMWLQKIAAIQDRRLGRTKDAISSLEKALELAPDSFPARQTLIELLTREGMWDELTAVIAGAPDSGAMSMRRAVVAEAAGDTKTAAEQYGRALEHGVKLARVPYLRVAQAEGRWDELEAHYAAVPESSDKNAVLHARYRAAELAHERLKRPTDAVRYLTEAAAAVKGSLSPVVAMLPLVAHVPETRGKLLGLLETMTTDPATRLACLRLQAHAQAAHGDMHATVSAHQKLLELQPSDPVSSVIVEIALEHQADRIGLANHLRRAATDDTLDPQLKSATLASLGSVLEQLGQLRDAALALEASREAAGEEVSRRTLLGLYRLYTALEDRDRIPLVLEALAECPPPGMEQAICLRRLAACWWMRGDAGRAADALRAALASDACDYEAIKALAELPNVAESELIDALMRAFELEQSPDTLRDLGNALAARLLSIGRLHTARETVDRVLAGAPDNLSAQMLLAEIHERRKSWKLAAAALERIASHDEASDNVKLEALRRLANIQVLHLRSPAQAKEVADLVAKLAPQDEVAQRVKLEVQVLAGEHEAAVATLTTITERDDVTPLARADDLLRLASLLDNKMNDPAAAIAALGKITGRHERASAVKRLLELGEKSGRWDLACLALEKSLNDEDEMDAGWECAIRRRLSQILRERLGRPDEAFRHEERIVELDPNDVATLERVIAGMTDTDPDRAIAYHRRLVDAAPERIGSYRALRNLFVDKGDIDGAFCAEAVLVGLGVATEEETYFYKGRRAARGARIAGTLSPVELALLCPERDHHALALFATIDALVPKMFKLDATGYGTDAGSTRSSGLTSVANQISHLLGAGNVSVQLVSPKLGPTVERDQDAIMMLPRGIEDGTPREQRFVCGALLARVALHGIAADPLRLNAFTDNQLNQLIKAALAIAAPDRGVEEPSGAVYADLKMKLDEALGEAARERLKLLVEDSAAALSHVDGAELRGTLSRAAARAAMLCSADPAEAIKNATLYARMFGEDPRHTRPGGIREDPVGKLPAHFHCALSFAVSEAHAKMRSRLLQEDGISD